MSIANIHGGSENAIKANGDRHSLIEKIDNSDFVVLDDMIDSEPRI
ncbi:MAG: hypothetical protein F6J98_16690 [Moorea sp. SIO4G2]|nr:hypothetical protein [Moorena sp. SIO3E8]NEO61983.1 hypothetical protein [Moorena sp. SIO4G2]